MAAETVPFSYALVVAKISLFAAGLILPSPRALLLRKCDFAALVVDEPKFVRRRGYHSFVAPIEDHDPRRAFRRRKLVDHFEVFFFGEVESDQVQHKIFVIQNWIIRHGEGENEGNEQERRGPCPPAPHRVYGWHDECRRSKQHEQEQARNSEPPLILSR